MLSCMVPTKQFGSLSCDLLINKCLYELLIIRIFRTQLQIELEATRKIYRSYGAQMQRFLFLLTYSLSEANSNNINIWYSIK